MVREDNKHIIEQPVNEMGRQKVSEGVRTGLNMNLILHAIPLQISWNHRHIL